MFFELYETNDYDVQLQNSQIFMDGIISSEDVLKLRFSSERAAIKTKHFANI